VRAFLTAGDPINAFDELGLTPLHHAVEGEHYEVVELLLRRGANVNAHCERMIGNTPLREAVSTCSLLMARRLVEAGADPTIRGWMQLSALDQAKQRKKKERTGSEGQAIYSLLHEATRRRKKGR
jgi:ankyrin repeat protein